MNRGLKLFETLVSGHEVGARHVELGAEFGSFKIGSRLRVVLARQIISELLQIRHLIGKIQLDCLLLQLCESAAIKQWSYVSGGVSLPGVSGTHFECFQ